MRRLPAGAFGFYAGSCLLGWIFCLFCFPETAGSTLEEVQLVFERGFGLKEMRATQKRRFAAQFVVVQREDPIPLTSSEKDSPSCQGLLPSPVA